MHRSPYDFCIVLGALATLGFAPFNITLFLIVAFALCYHLIVGCDSKLKVFFCGIWFGVAHFSTSFYWFGIALATDIIKFGWLIPFAVFGLSLFFALYTGLAFVIFRLIKFKNPITFALIFFLCEFLRATLFSGFPWNLAGYTWQPLEILQSASIFGIWGLSFFTFFLSGAIGALLVSDSFLNRAYLVFASLFLVSIFYFGNYRLQNNPTKFGTERVRLVQANISHQAKWTKDYADQVVRKYVDLTNKSSLKGIDYVIWPESSLPFLLARDSLNVASALFDVIPKTLIAGGERIEKNKIFNTIFVMKDGKIIDYYDKVHLVPFGEYMPFKKFLPVQKIVSGVSDFSDGDNSKKVFKDINALPSICYESIFPNALWRKQKMDWILNLTNDSWFGISSGPYQHLQMAKVRAIEQGMPLIRSTTTGISAVFDAYGRPLAKSDLNQEAVIDTNLPKKSTKETLYRKIMSLF